METRQIPFYVVLSSYGPNNTEHPKYVKPIRYNEERHQQYFKIVEIDDKYKSSGRDWVTYLTEDGYCLWSGCVKETSQQEYEQERNIIGIQEALIFN